VRILRRHIEFILQAADTSNEDLASILTPDYLRGMLRGVVERGMGLLSESQQLWLLWLEWETNNGPSEVVHQLYMERIAQPHVRESRPCRSLTVEIDETMSAYSSYCTQNAPNDYEQRMVQATATSQGAKQKLNAKRRQQSRLDFEQQLVSQAPS
jgi:Tfp pilus assembly protein PilW